MPKRRTGPGKVHLGGTISFRQMLGCSWCRNSRLHSYYPQVSSLGSLFLVQLFPLASAPTHITAAVADAAATSRYAPPQSGSWLPPAFSLGAEVMFVMF